MTNGVLTRSTVNHDPLDTAAQAWVALVVYLEADNLSTLIFCLPLGDSRLDLSEVLPDRPGEVEGDVTPVTQGNGLPLRGGLPLLDLCGGHAGGQKDDDCEKKDGGENVKL